MLLNSLAWKTGRLQDMFCFCSAEIIIGCSDITDEKPDTDTEGIFNRSSLDDFNTDKSIPTRFHENRII